MVALSQSKSRCPVSSKCLYIVDVVAISFWSFPGALLFLTLIHDLSLHSRPVSSTYVGETGLSNICWRDVNVLVNVNVLMPSRNSYLNRRRAMINRFE